MTDAQLATLAAREAYRALPFATSRIEQRYEPEVYNAKQEAKDAAFKAWQDAYENEKRGAANFHPRVDR